MLVPPSAGCFHQDADYLVCAERMASNPPDSSRSPASYRPSPLKPPPPPPNPYLVGLSSSSIAPPSHRGAVGNAAPPPVRETIKPPIAPPAEPETIASSPTQRSSGAWNWLIVWLGLTAFCGGTGAVAFLWLSSIPPLPDCKQVSPLTTDADRLYCAQQAVQTGELDSLAKGLELVKSLPKEHPLHSKAERFMVEWSQSVLGLARQKLAQNDLEAAIAIAQKIPPNTPLRKQADSEIAAWKKNWDQGSKIHNQIQTALKNQAWQEALKQVKALAEVKSDQWQQQIGPLRRQVRLERQARSQLERARFMVAAEGDVAMRVGQAIALAQEVDPNSYAYEEARGDITRWSRSLVELATLRLQEGDRTGAIAAVQPLPLNTPLNAQVRDLVWIAKAQQLADDRKVSSTPLLQQIWQLSTVILAVRGTAPASPFYSQAQATLPLLERQLQDWIQLHTATSVAQAGNKLALQLAIQYAEAVVPGRPGRVHAQTLIARWRRDIQRIEDHPYLLTAHELAKAGTIPQLKAAIAEASRIAPKRALRSEAQAMVARWTRQIQTIEDRPILDQARALAKQGKLAKAIQTASKIRLNRALRKEAQGAIREWVVQIQTIEDRPILNQAWALANQGSWTEAINIASQIRPGRALYGEAQDAIAQWAALREDYYRRQSLDRGRGPAPSAPETLPSESSPSTAESPSAEDDPISPEEP